MESLETRLEKLRGELKECDDEIKNTQRKLQDAQQQISEANSRRSELNAKITSLQGEMSEIQASRTAIENEKNAADSEIEDAKKTIAEVEGKIPPDRLEAIKAAVKAAVNSVDDDIDRRQKAVVDVQGKLTEAEKALTVAQSKVATDEGEVGKIKGLLKSLPNKSKTARSMVSRLKSTIRSMAKSGQINDVLYTVQELNRVIGELETLVDPKEGEKLINELIDHQQKVNAGKDDVAKKSAACEQLRRDVAAVEGEYENAVKMREAAIKAKLAAPLEKDEPGPAPGGNPASEHEEQPAESSC